MMLTRKQFQYNIPKGTIEVQFNIEDEANEFIISNILLHSVFKSGLPDKPTLEYHNNKWVLGKWCKKEESGRITEVCMYFDNKLTAGIIREIFRIKKEYAAGRCFG